MTAYRISLSLTVPGRDRNMGGVVVSAEIIPFISRLNRKREPVHFQPAAFVRRVGPMT
jgi:hypothetical protein